ncbi:hypothetical protein XI09_01120 [Bradyrhizobium sp. CCBAU 11386]|nr:hypothetical protein [Bradyrhizobium sp. CCBAU 11386]
MQSERKEKPCNGIDDAKDQDCRRQQAKNIRHSCPSWPEHHRDNVIDEHCAKNGDGNRHGHNDRVSLQKVVPQPNAIVLNPR